MLAPALALALTLGASSTATQETVPTPPPAEKKICRAVTPTGSVMAKRVCLTKAEWKKLNGSWSQQNARFQDVQNRSATNPAP